MINVPVAFRSVTETRITTYCYIGVVNFHEHLVKHTYEHKNLKPVCDYVFHNNRNNKNKTKNVKFHKFLYYFNN